MTTVDNNFILNIKNICVDSLKEVVKTGQSFIPRMHIIGKENKVVFLPFKNDEEKRTMLLSMGALIFEEKSHQIIFICDAYLRKFNTVKEAEDVSKNWDTEKPSLYPESMRSNALTICVMNFKDSNAEKMIIITYEKKENNLVIISEDILPFEQGSIKEFIIEGFARAKIIDILERREITVEQMGKMHDYELKNLLSEVSLELNEEFPNLQTNLKK